MCRKVIRQSTKEHWCLQNYGEQTLLPKHAHSDHMLGFKQEVIYSLEKWVITDSLKKVVSFYILLFIYFCVGCRVLLCSLS